MADGHGISIFDKLKQGLTIIATPLLKPPTAAAPSSTSTLQPKNLKVEKSIRSSTSGVTVSLASNCSKKTTPATAAAATSQQLLPPQTSITPVSGNGGIIKQSSVASTSSSTSSSALGTSSKKCAKKAENECATTLLKKTTSSTSKDVNVDGNGRKKGKKEVVAEEVVDGKEGEEEDDVDDDGGDGEGELVGDDGISSPNEDGNRRKKKKTKRCSDRYDSSESSDSGVATSLSCTDSSTASSDTSDPGSPFSSGSPTEDVHRKSSKMSANTELITITPVPDTNKKLPTATTKQSSSLWPWGKTNGSGNNTNSNKRVSNDLTTNITIQPKKTRTILPNGPLINTIGGVTVTPVGPPSGGRRQQKQAPSAEESQTKITGYFKAQMKLAKNNKEKQLLPPQEQQNTTANLNKFFNVLKKNCDNDQQRENSVLSAALSSSNTSLDMIPIKNATTTPTSSAPVSTPSVPNGTTITPVVNNKNLKKNTKIAQVAPNLRKPAVTNGTSKNTTPQKKHVAIAPRTAEILPKIQPQKQQPQPQPQPQNPVPQPQPTVLLTTLRLPNQPQTLVQTPTTISYQLPGNMGHFVTIPNNTTSSNAANIVLNNGQLTRMATTPTNHAPQFFFGNGGTFFKFQHMQQMQQFSSTTATNGATTVANTQNLIMKTSRQQQQQLVQTSQQLNQQIGKQRAGQQPILIPTAGAMVAIMAGTPTMPALQPINPTGASQAQFLPQQQQLTIQPPQSSPQPPPLAFTGPAKMGINSSEPPPLVTISSNKPVAQLSSSNNNVNNNNNNINNNIENEQKIPPLVPRFQPQVRVISTASLLKSPTTNTSITASSNGSPSSGKITSSEPPSLIPTPRIPPFSINEKEKDDKSNCCELLEIKEESKLFDVKEEIKDEKVKLLEYEIKKEKETSETLLMFQDEISISSTIQSTLSSTNDTIETNIKESIALATAEFLNSTTPTIPPEIDTNFNEESSNIKSAISPILSQPKTIRFPALNKASRGVKRRHDGICHWENCNIKHDSVSKLVDHLHTKHVVSQNGPFSCLWVGCRVYGSESCSRRWLERHVASYHGSSKEFKCIVDGCGLRFASQLALQKHVNQHFNAMDNKEGSNKRTSDPPVPKVLKKNGKKLKYRRTPFSARLFDFFDHYIMEGLDNRLIKMSNVTDLMTNTMTFTGSIVMTRKKFNGSEECLIKWSPPDIISDEWVPKDSPAKKKFTKTVKMKTLQPKEKLAADRLIQSTYRNIQRPKEPLCLDILKPTQEQIQTTASNAPQIQEETCSVKVSGSKRRKQYSSRISTS